MKRTNRVRLTESQLHRVIKESVKRVLKENASDYRENSYYNDVQYFYQALKPAVDAMEDDFVENRLHETKEELLQRLAKFAAEESYSLPRYKDEETLRNAPYRSTLPTDY